MQIFTREQRLLFPNACTDAEYREALGSVRVVQHPVVADGIRALRSRTTKKVKFGEYAERVGQVLLLDAISDLTLEEVEIETPLRNSDGSYVRTPAQKLTPDDMICFVIVIRAGLALWQRSILPKSPVGTYDIERDEATTLPHLHRVKLPAGIKERRVIILEPMLATGGTTAFVIGDLKQRGVKEIRLISIFAAAHGVLRLKRQYPDVQIVAGALDPALNEKCFIEPGCGDFGDRALGTATDLQ